MNENEILPVPAPRRSRSRDNLDGNSESTPSVPLRRKKKTAPIPPYLDCNGSFSEPMKTSTMISSTTSLPKLADVSPVRPSRKSSGKKHGQDTSAVEDLSCFDTLPKKDKQMQQSPTSSRPDMSTNPTYRKMKKRRAPLPPSDCMDSKNAVKNEKETVEVKEVENLSRSLKNTFVNRQDLTISSVDNDNHDSSNLVKAYKFKEDHSDLITEVKAKKKTKKRKHKDSKIMKKDKKQNTKDENQTLKVPPKKNSGKREKKNKQKEGMSKHDIKVVYDTEQIDSNISNINQNTNEDVQVFNSNHMRADHNKDYKIERDRNANNLHESSLKEGKLKNSKVNRSDIPHFRMIKAADVHQIGSNKDSKEYIRIENDSTDQEEFIENYEMFEMDEADKDSKNKTGVLTECVNENNIYLSHEDKGLGEPVLTSTTSKVKSYEIDLPRDINHLSQKTNIPLEVIGQTDDGENDQISVFETSNILENTDIDIVDTHEKFELQRSDGVGNEKKEHYKVTKEISQEVPSKENVFRLSGKEQEVIAREKIFMEMKTKGARANRRASQGGDLLSTHLESETIRQKLRIISEEDSNPVQPQRYPDSEGIHLDIDSEDDLLPSILSSRSNSTEEITNIGKVKEPEGMVSLSTSLKGNDEAQFLTGLAKAHEYEISEKTVFTGNESKIISEQKGGIENKLCDEDGVGLGQPISVKHASIDSIKSLSPDSGIHDFAEPCSSPVSVSYASERKDKIDLSNPDVSVSCTREWSDEEFRMKTSSNASKTSFRHEESISTNGFGKTEIECLDSDIPVVNIGNPNLYDDIHESKEKTRKYHEDEHELEKEIIHVEMKDVQDERDVDKVKIEKVELPRQHNQGKVLFSLSSYGDRTKTFEKLQAKSRNDVEKKSNIPVTENRAKLTLSEERTKLKDMDLIESTQPEYHDIPSIGPMRRNELNTTISSCEQSKPTNQLDFSENHLSMNFRSRIIEEFESKRKNSQVENVTSDGYNVGVREIPRPLYARQTTQLLAAQPDGWVNGSSSLGRKVAMGGGKDREWSGKFHSLDRTQYRPDKNGVVSLSAIVSDRRKLMEENHYDSPRSLLAKPTWTNRNNQNDSDISNNQKVSENRHAVNKVKNSGPPSISMGVWGEPSRDSLNKIRRDKNSNIIQNKFELRNEIPSPETFSQGKQTKLETQTTQKTCEDFQRARSPWRNSTHSSHIHTPEISIKPVEIRYKVGQKQDQLKEVQGKEAKTNRKSRWINELTKDMDALRADHPSEDSSRYSYNSLDNKRVSKFQEKAYKDNISNATGPRSMPINPKLGRNKCEVSSTQDGKEIIKIERDTVLKHNNPQSKFYFGMIETKEEEPSMLKSITAVGKVKENQALSQPFRKPREVHLNHVVPENPEKNDKSSNGFRSSHTMPTRQPLQEEVNKAFAEELLKAKTRLKSLSRAPVEHDADGAPPPPPAPVLPLSLRSTQVKPVFIPKQDPRQDLLAAIRNSGGINSLRKTKTQS